MGYDILLVLNYKKFVIIVEIIKHSSPPVKYQSLSGYSFINVYMKLLYDDFAMLKVGHQ